MRLLKTDRTSFFTAQRIAISVLLVGLSIISRLGMIAWPFLNDSGLYAAMGRSVAQGQVIYRDFYETKLPGSFLLASAFWRAFGPHWVGYVLCELALAMLAAAALGRTARRHLGSALPTFLFAAVFLNLSQAVYTGFQLETLQAFFEALAAMAAIEAVTHDDPLAAFAAGLSAGMAGMAKPGGLGVAVVFALILILFGRRRLIQLVALVIGVAIPTGATLFYTIRSGAWPYLPGVLRDIGHYAAGTPVGGEAIVKLLMVFAILGFAFLFRWKSKIGGTPMLRAFTLAWFAVDLLAVLLQRRLYPYHCLPLACPAALLYGMVSRQTKPFAIAAGLLPIALLSLTWEGSSISEIHRGFEHMPVSDYIAAHTTANDTVFADQIGRLLIETDRNPGSRLGTFFYLVNDDAAPQRYSRVLLNDFESLKPRYLVLPDGWDRPVPGLADCEILRRCPGRRENFIAAWAVVREYVAGHYHQESALDGMRIYRRSRG